MNLDLLLLLLTTLQCATGVFCRSYGDGKPIDVTKLTTNAARMRAGFPPMKPINLNMPSRVQGGGKIKYFYFIFIPISFACSSTSAKSIAVNGIPERVSLFYDSQLVVLAADDIFLQCHRIYTSKSRKR